VYVLPNWMKMLGALQNVVPIGQVMFPHPAKTVLVRATMSKVTRRKRNMMICSAVLVSKLWSGVVGVDRCSDEGDINVPSLY